MGWSEAHKEVVDGLVITVRKDDDPNSAAEVVSCHGVEGTR